MGQTRLIAIKGYIWTTICQCVHKNWGLRAVRAYFYCIKFRLVLLFESKFDNFSQNLRLIKFIVTVHVYCKIGIRRYITLVVQFSESN